MDSGGVGGSPRAELFDLSENALMSIFNGLDFESLVMMAMTAKKLNGLANEELLWMKLCRSWENVVDLKSWRARMDSGKALFRLLRSLSKLVGIWNHDGHGPHGRLLYFTWVPEGLEGWLVAPGVVEEDYMMFIKLLDVTGTPDGSHKVELVVTDEEYEEELDPVKARIVLPSPRSPNHFVLESHDASGTELERNSNGVRFEIARGQDLGLFLGDAGDKNVPCGEISFTACVELELTDLPDGVDSILTKMYKGQGRTADTNFVDPKWEQGYLLVEQSGNFRFVWEGMNVNFRRLDMDEAFKNKDPDIMLT